MYLDFLNKMLMHRSARYEFLFFLWLNKIIDAPTNTFITPIQSAKCTVFASLSRSTIPVIYHTNKFFRQYGIHVTCTANNLESFMRIAQIKIIYTILCM